jgi:carbonic anhydrase
MENYIKNLLDNNLEWVKSQLETDPEYFTRAAQGQSPKVLWLGCSDSRVLPDDITGTGKGDFFVHRNIANLVTYTDFNFLSVLKYAVEYLGVEHIIVCGHYECGGVKAAMGDSSYGLMDNWLHQIRDTLHFYEEELEKLDEHARFRRLVELNVVEQISHLGNINTVREAWQKGRKPQLHGWVYDIGTGYVKSIVSGVVDIPSLKQHCKYEKR